VPKDLTEVIKACNSMLRVNFPLRRDDGSIEVRRVCASCVARGARGPASGVAFRALAAAPREEDLSSAAAARACNAAELRERSLYPLLCYCLVGGVAVGRCTPGLAAERAWFAACVLPHGR
jgi:hypothetical protein